MTAIVHDQLRNAFLATRHTSIIDEICDPEHGISDAEILERLETLAEEGFIDAQTALAELHIGENPWEGNFHFILSEDLRSPDRARHWAMKCSPVANDEDSAYDLINMARVLVRFEDEASRLRAISLVMKVLCAPFQQVHDSATEILREHFADFDLEECVRSSRPAPVVHLPEAPQRRLI